MSLVITRVAGLVTVQDLGRPGRMHEALAPGGALVPELLVAANRAARNADGDPAIEVLGRLVVRAEGTTIVAVDAPLVLQDGEELVIASEPRRVAYLAIRGGVDAPLVLGGRATQLSAGLGKPLRTGERLASAGAFEVDSPVEPFVDTGEVGVIAGPDLDAFAPDALAQLVAAPYRILPTSDRVGSRLDGRVIARAPGYSEISRPMVRGAIEVPPDGLPIVLGPEHPTTGGYPVIAVIAHADLGRFFAIRLGGSVRFAAR
jgi:allophanate hydrolase subunit 2